MEYLPDRSRCGGTPQAMTGLRTQTVKTVAVGTRTLAGKLPGRWGITMLKCPYSTVRIRQETHRQLKEMAAADDRKIIVVLARIVAEEVARRKRQEKQA